jgi:hypothetical protein
MDFTKIYFVLFYFGQRLYLLSVDIKSWDNREHLCRRVCLWKKVDVKDFSVEQPEEITESANAVISKKNTNIKYENYYR